MSESPANESLARVRAEARALRDDHISLLREMIAAQRDGETKVQAIVARRLAAIGAEVGLLDYAPSDVPLAGEFAAGRAIAPGRRQSVVGTLHGAGGGRSLILFAHPDSEPVADTESWSRDPFEGVIDGGRLHGWGVADDLAGVAAGVAAMTALAKAGLKPGGDVFMASTPSKRHARGVAALMNGGLTADAAVYLHPAESGVGLNEIKAVASGQVEFRITVRGRHPDTKEPCHTAFAHLAVNPVDKAFLIHQALRALDARRGKRVKHPLLEAAVGRSTNLQVSSIACGEETELSRLSLSCVLGCALSFPPNERMEEVQAEVQAAVDAAAAGDDWLRDNPPVLEWNSGVTGAETSLDHPLYLIAAGAVTAVTGIEPYVNPMHTVSDIRNPIVQKGIPTVGLGPLCGDLTQVGKTDEWVDLEDYLGMVEVVATIITQWTGARA